MHEARTRPGGRIVSATGGAGIAGGIAIITVPAGKIADMRSIDLDLTCTATGGNRVVIVTVWIGGAIYWIGRASAATIANQICGYDVFFGRCPGTNTTVRRNIANTANTNIQVQDTCPIEYLPAGSNIYVNEVTGVDAADAVAYRITYIEYDA